MDARSSNCIDIQETCLALLFVRYVLLRYDPQLCFLVVPSVFTSTVRRVLHTLTRVSCKRCDNMEKLSCVSRSGQSYLSLYSYICTLHFHRDTVRSFLLDATPAHLHCRHFYPDAAERFPALLEVPHLQPMRALLLTGGICKALRSFFSLVS